MSREARGRIRTIKPEIWDSEDVGALSLPARLLFVGLMTRADDEGRCRGNPAWLKGQLFPYDEEVTPGDIDEWLTELERRQMAVRYDVQGKSYVALTAWSAHQVISHPSPSKIPPPPTDVFPGQGVDDGSNHASSGGIRRNPEESIPRVRAPDLDLDLDHSLSSSARSSTACSCPQPVDDDDEVIIRTLTAVGVRRHAEAVAAGQLTNPTSSTKRGHRKACVDDATADPELRGRVVAVRRKHPDWPPDLLAEAVDGPDPASNGHPSPPRFECGVCGWQGVGDRCAVDHQLGHGA